MPPTQPLNIKLCRSYRIILIVYYKLNEENDGIIIVSKIMF